ncbi:hypothetical protein Emed_007562 [Eimeria media]
MNDDEELLGQDTTDAELPAAQAYMETDTTSEEEKTSWQEDQTKTQLREKKKKPHACETSSKKTHEKQLKASSQLDGNAVSYGTLHQQLPQQQQMNNACLKQNEFSQNAKHQHQPQQAHTTAVHGEDTKKPRSTGDPTPTTLETRTHTSFAKKTRTSADALDPARQAQQVRATSSPQGDGSKLTAETQETRHPPATIPSQAASFPLHAAAPRPPGEAHEPHQSDGSSGRIGEEGQNVGLEEGRSREQPSSCKVFDKGGSSTTG